MNRHGVLYWLHAMLAVVQSGFAIGTIGAIIDADTPEVRAIGLVLLGMLAASAVAHGFAATRALNGKCEQ